MQAIGWIRYYCVNRAVISRVQPIETIPVNQRRVAVSARRLPSAIVRQVALNVANGISSQVIDAARLPNKQFRSIQPQVRPDRRLRSGTVHLRDTLRDLLHRQPLGRLVQHAKDGVAHLTGSVSCSLLTHTHNVDVQTSCVKARKHHETVVIPA